MEEKWEGMGGKEGGYRDVSEMRKPNGNFMHKK